VFNKDYDSQDALQVAKTALAKMKVVTERYREYQFSSDIFIEGKRPLG